MLTNFKFTISLYSSDDNIVLVFQTETILSVPSITTLDLTYNRIEILEGSLAEIKGLASLNISHNRLSSLPTSFFDGMQELQHLDVSNNLLHTLTDIAEVNE